MSDSGILYSEADAVKVKLLQGVIYSDDVAAWECLLRCKTELRSFFAQLAIGLEIDEAEGYAWLKQHEPGDDPPANFPPRLFRRVALSYDVTLLCVLLRERLLGFEKDQPDARTLVLNQEEIYGMLGAFLDTSGDEVRRKRELQSSINRVVELGFLRQVEGGSNPQYEVRRILRARIPVEVLAEIKEELKAHAERLA
jgi:hypothetical protein